MSERAPFDASDPLDAMSEMFRLQVTDMALDAYKVTLYREMNPQQQLECFLAGALTGVVGVTLASVGTKDVDTLMKYLTECLPIARQMAEGIMAGAGRPLKNHHDKSVAASSTKRKGGGQ